MENFIDIPVRKSFNELGLDEFGQSPLQFDGKEKNKQSQTMGEAGLPAKYIIDGNEGWVQKGQSQILISSGQDLQSALDMVLRNGGGTVSLNPGIYLTHKDIYIGSGVTLEGAGTFITIIDFDGGPYSVHIEGEDSYSDGTVAVTQGSTTITGSSTNWTLEMVGQSILIDGDWYDIDAYVSPTELTLSSGFSGANQAGLSYAIATLNSFSSIKNCTVQNSSADLIKMRYAYNAMIDSVARYGGDKGISIQDTVFPFIRYGEGADSITGIYFNNSFSYIMQSEFIYNCSGNGIEIENGGDATGGIDFGVSNCGGIGIKLTNASKIAFWSFTVDNNVSHGIEEVSGCNDNTYSGGSIHDNGGDGMKMTATSDRNSMAQLQFIDNTGYGVNMAAATDNDNIILGNVFSGNGSGAVNDSGTTTKIRSNIGVADN